jgi:hypothetical protein
MFQEFEESLAKLAMDLPADVYSEICAKYRSLKNKIETLLNKE